MEQQVGFRWLARAESCLVVQYAEDLAGTSSPIVRPRGYIAQS